MISHNYQIYKALYKNKDIHSQITINYIKTKNMILSIFDIFFFPPVNLIYFFFTYHPIEADELFGKFDLEKDVALNLVAWIKSQPQFKIGKILFFYSSIIKN